MMPNSLKNIEPCSNFPILDPLSISTTKYLSSKLLLIDHSAIKIKQATRYMSICLLRHIANVTTRFNLRYAFYYQKGTTDP